MKIPIFQIDAFSDRVFGGNPAAVCPLEFWLEDEILQRIALENNLSETAFLVRRRGGRGPGDRIEPQPADPLLGTAAGALGFDGSSVVAARR